MFSFSCGSRSTPTRLARSLPKSRKRSISLRWTLRANSPQQKALALLTFVAGLVFVALGTWGPYRGVWINGMIPVNVMGGIASVLAIVLFVVGPARRNRE